MKTGAAMLSSGRFRSHRQVVCSSPLLATTRRCLACRRPGLRAGKESPCFVDAGRLSLTQAGQCYRSRDFTSKIVRLQNEGPIPLVSNLIACRCCTNRKFQRACVHTFCHIRCRCPPSVRPVVFFERILSGNITDSRTAPPCRMERTGFSQFLQSIGRPRGVDGVRGCDNDYRQMSRGAGGAAFSISVRPLFHMLSHFMALL